MKRPSIASILCAAVLVCFAAPSRAQNYEGKFDGPPPSDTKDWKGSSPDRSSGQKGAAAIELNGPNPLAVVKSQGDDPPRNFTPAPADAPAQTAPPETICETTGFCNSKSTEEFLRLLFLKTPPNAAPEPGAECRQEDFSKAVEQALKEGSEYPFGIYDPNGRSKAYPECRFLWPPGEPRDIDPYVEGDVLLVPRDGKLVRMGVARAVSERKGGKEKYCLPNREHTCFNRILFRTPEPLFARHPELREHMAFGKGFIFYITSPMDAAEVMEFSLDVCGQIDRFRNHPEQAPHNNERQALEAFHKVFLQPIAGECPSGQPSRT